MARPLRLELGGGLYHVTSRGDRREDIYLSDEDRLTWLDTHMKPWGQVFHYNMFMLSWMHYVGALWRDL